MNAYNIIRQMWNRGDFMVVNRIKPIQYIVHPFGLIVPLKHKFNVELRRGSKSIDDQIDFYLYEASVLQFIYYLFTFFFNQRTDTI